MKNSGLHTAMTPPSAFPVHLGHLIYLSSLIAFSQLLPRPETGRSPPKCKPGQPLISSCINITSSSRLAFQSKFRILGCQHPGARAGLYVQQKKNLTVVHSGFQTSAVLWRPLLSAADFLPRRLAASTFPLFLGLIFTL